MLRKIVITFTVGLVATAAFASSIQVPAVRDVAGGDPLALGDLTYRGMQDPRFAARVEHHLAEHGFDHPERLDLAGRPPLDVARAILHDETHAGRAVADWVRLARAESLLALRPDAPAAPEELAGAIERLDAAVGFPLDAAQRARVQAQADALPLDVREPFAALVAAVADAYAAQVPLAAGVVARVDDAQRLAFALTDEEREATLANALALVAAQNAFRVAVEGVEWPASADPLVHDPKGLVILGSLGSDTYERDGVLRDPVLLVDPAGDDTYHVAAGAACPDTNGLVHDCNGLALALHVDLLGDDLYSYAGVPTNAQASASLGAIGVLVDVTGNDHYYAEFAQTTALGPFWGGVLGYIDAGNQGYALAGVGILLDATGNDIYAGNVTSSRSSIWGFSQGFGNAGGVGIASDGVGDDRWLAYGKDGGLAVGRGFQGLYPGGTGFFGGLGIMTDTGLGRDAYHAWDNATTTDFYAFGFGAFGGTGIFYEDGGDDHYEAVEDATNPFILPLLNCAYGTASFAGLGVFLEMGGHDAYFGDTRSPRGVATMNEGFGGPLEGEGLFMDVSGDDGHFMEAHEDGVLDYAQTHGRGLLFGGGEGVIGGNTVGVYLDLGGADAYTGASPSRNNAAWLLGLDLEAGRVPDTSSLRSLG